MKMRIAIIVMLIMFLTFSVNVNAEGQKIITYENMLAGNYDGDRFRVIAKPIEGTIYGEPAWQWYVRNRGGNFLPAGGGYDWVIQDYELERLPIEQQTAIKAGEEFVLIVEEMAGNFYIKKFEKYDPSAQRSDTGDNAAMIFCLVFIGGCAIAVVIGVVYFKVKKKRGIARYGSEEKWQEAQREAEIIDWQLKEWERERKERSTRVVKTRIIDSYSHSHTTGRVSTSSAVGRGIVGGMIAGPLGAAVGAGTAKKKYTTSEQRTVVFKVWYADGHDEIKKVTQGSADYNKFIEKIEN